MLLAAACGPDTVAPTTGGGFRPELVDLGEVAVGTVGIARTRLAAGSQGRTTAVRFEPEAGVFGVFRVEGGLPLLGTSVGGGGAEVEIRFGPTRPGRFDTVLHVEVGTSSFELPIMATARAVRPAGLDGPRSVDFGSVAVGGARSRSVTVTNDGELEGLLVHAAVQGDGFELGPLALPRALAPSEGLSVDLAYRPSRFAAQDEGALVLALADGTELRVELVGRPRDEAPSLRCPAMALDLGSAPRGETLTGQVECERLEPGWTLVSWRLAPSSDEGFAVDGPPLELGPNRVGIPIRFDALGAVGAWNGALDLVGPDAVENRIAVTASVAAPGPGQADLFLRLEWDRAEGDLDLHLVREGGRRFESDEDCHYGDKNPDWGESGRRLDDPFLDRDDRDGLGPEQLALIDAREAAYEVFVQFHDDTGVTAAPTATLRWHTREGRSGALDRVLAQCGDGWHVGRFRREADGLHFDPVDGLDRAFADYAAEACR